MPGTPKSKTFEETISNIFLFPEKIEQKDFLNNQLKSLNALPSGKGLLDGISHIIKTSTNSGATDNSTKKMTFSFSKEESTRASYENSSSNINMVLPYEINAKKKLKLPPSLDIPAITSRKVIQTQYGPLDVVAVTQEKSPFYVGLGHELIHALHNYDGSNKDNKRTNGKLEPALTPENNSRFDGIQNNPEEFFTVLNIVGPSEWKLNKEYQQTIPEKDRIGPRYIYQSQPQKIRY